MRLKALAFGCGFFLAFANSIAAQVITTAAGTDFSFPETPLPALSAPIRPYGVVPDNKGNLYIADTYNNMVFRLSPGGTLNTVAGTGFGAIYGDGGPALTASLDGPSSVALDSQGNLYVLSCDVVRKISSAGVITPFISGFYCASGIAVDRQDNLYISEDRQNRIWKVSSTGVASVIAGGNIGFPGTFGGDGGPAVKASLNFPSAVSVD